MKSKKKSLLAQILFLLFIIALYRIGAHIPLPGVDIEGLQAINDSERTASILDLFSGKAFSQASLLSLGVTPYITALIVFQLLENTVPALKELKKQGSAGRRKLSSFTRVLALFVATLQAFTVVTLFHNGGIGSSDTNIDLFPQYDLYHVTLAVLTLLTGFMLLLWFANLLTNNGLGNGMSVLILASVVAGIVGQIQGVSETDGLGKVVLVLLVIFLTTALVTALNLVERQVVLHSAQKNVRKRKAGGTYIPLRPLQSGVAPAIFATAFIGILASIERLLPQTGTLGALRSFLTDYTTGTSFTALLVLAGLVLFFTYFYTALTFNTTEISEDLAKRGMFVLSVRPGEETVYHLARVLARLAIAGGIVLAFVTLLPALADVFLGIKYLPLAGTSLLIATSVTLDAVKQYNARKRVVNYDAIIGWDKLDGLLAKRNQEALSVSSFKDGAAADRVAARTNATGAQELMIVEDSASR